MNKTVNFWIFGISIILLGASLFLNISSIVVSNEAIVLVFVGILATFIVVGNFAQVSEIRNTTEKQIKYLEQETKKKFDEINKLIDKVNISANNIEEMEKNILFTAAEGYRLYGAFSMGGHFFRTSTIHLLNATSLYIKTNRNTSMIPKLLDVVLVCLNPENWNNDQSKEEFNYEKNIDNVKGIPETYDQRQKIIDLLEKYMKEESQKKEKKTNP